VHRGFFAAKSNFRHITLPNAAFAPPGYQSINDTAAFEPTRGHDPVDLPLTSTLSCLQLSRASSQIKAAVKAAKQPKTTIAATPANTNRNFFMLKSSVPDIHRFQELSPIDI